MSTYERESWVRAPLDEVWAFHSRATGLEALTPPFLHLRIEAIRGPDGDRLSVDDDLDAGATIRSSIRPFGVGPRQTWTSRIVAREERDGSAYFRDTMTDGPFPEWTHTHSFFAADDRTLVRDQVHYRLPLGPLGDVFGPFAVVGFEPIFRYRHRKTRDLLE